jgi:hypothetical protein
METLMPGTGQGVTDAPGAMEAGQATQVARTASIDALHELRRCGEHINAARCGVDVSGGNPHTAALVVTLDELCGAVAALAGVVAGLVLQS